MLRPVSRRVCHWFTVIVGMTRSGTVAAFEAPVVIDLLSAAVTMKVFAFASAYPLPFKPYYDTQFSAWIEQGHDVRVFAMEGDRTVQNEKVRRFGLEARTSHLPHGLSSLPRFLIPAAAGLAGRLRGSLRVIGAVSQSQTSLKARLLGVARAALISRDVPDLCLVHGLGTALYVPWLRELFPGIPIAMYYHGGEVPSVQRWDDRRVHEAFDGMDVVFTNTNFSKQNAIERGCPEDKLVILPVGFDLRDFVPANPREYRRGGHLNLLSAGRMSEEKGFDDALEAIRILVANGIQDIRYSLTGEGYVRPRLEAFVQEHGLQPYVRFLGTLSTEGVLRAMEHADALVLSSVRVGDWVENQACAVQEAMLMGALPLITRTGGVPESIPSEMLPFSVAEHDAAGLAASIERVWKMSEPEIRSLSATCRRFVEDGYEIGALNDRLVGMARAYAGEGGRRLSNGAGIEDDHAADPQAFASTR
jgi:colanic acid/amylovoran biosynthesis glycosyltransferase